MVLTSEPMFSRVLPPTVSKFESLSNPPPQQPVHPLSPSRLEVVIELPAQTSRFATGVCGEKMILGRVILDDLVLIWWYHVATSYQLIDIITMYRTVETRTMERCEHCSKEIFISMGGEATEQAIP